MKIFIILNHQLNDEQVSELRKKGFNEIITLNDEQKKIWGNIDPEKSKEEIEVDLKPILAQIAEVDAVICQGDFTAFSIVKDFAKRMNKDFFVATTKRETKEVQQEDGSVKKIAIFKHIQFRKL